VVLQIAAITGYGEGSTYQKFLSVLLTSLVAAITVGGKALGKYFAIHASTKIIFFAGKVITIMQNKLKIKVLPGK
jgi:hypothetical protein